MDAHSNLAAFFVELVKLRKYASTIARVFVFERAMSLVVSLCHFPQMNWNMCWRWFGLQLLCQLVHKLRVTDEFVQFCWVNKFVNFMRSFSHLHLTKIGLSDT